MIRTRIQPRVQFPGLTLPDVFFQGRYSNTLEFVYNDGERAISRYLPISDIRNKGYAHPRIRLEITSRDDTYISEHDWQRRTLDDFKGRYPQGVLDTLEGPLLDVGTAEGELVGTLNQRGIKAYGLDSYLTASQLRSSYFIPGLAHRTGLPDESIKTILLNFVTDYGSSGERMNFDYLQRLATEQIRILMPGGRIFIYPVRSDESFLD
ncbi:MAG: hypothetical protein ABIH82_06380, partial [Candidatus Woesearchaeota archaeon]